MLIAGCLFLIFYVARRVHGIFQEEEEDEDADGELEKKFRAVVSLSAAP